MSKSLSPILNNAFIQTTKPPAKKKKVNNSKVVKAQKNDATCRKTTNSIIYRSPLKYFQENEEWRCNACSKLKLSFRKMDRVSPGSLNTPLGPPNPYNIKSIQGDGNCLFRTFSYVLTGVENQHMKIHEIIISHMYTIGHLLIGPHITETSVNEYIYKTQMDKDKTWGTYVEILVFSHLLQTSVLSYDVPSKMWARYCPHALDNAIVDNFSQMSIYLQHPLNHFEVVRSIL